MSRNASLKCFSSLLTTACLLSALLASACQQGQGGGSAPPDGKGSSDSTPPRVRWEFSKVPDLNYIYKVWVDTYEWKTILARSGNSVVAKKRLNNDSPLFSIDGGKTFAQKSVTGFAKNSKNAVFLDNWNIKEILAYDDGFVFIDNNHVIVTDKAGAGRVAFRLDQDDGLGKRPIDSAIVSKDILILLQFDQNSVIKLTEGTGFEVLKNNLCDASGNPLSSLKKLGVGINDEVYAIQSNGQIRRYAYQNLLVAAQGKKSIADPPENTAGFGPGQKGWPTRPNDMHGQPQVKTITATKGDMVLFNFDSVKSPLDASYFNGRGYYLGKLGENIQRADDDKGVSNFWRDGSDLYAIDYKGLRLIDPKTGQMSAAAIDRNFIKNKKEWVDKNAPAQPYDIGLNAENQDTEVVGYYSDIAGSVIIITPDEIHIGVRVES